MYEWKTVLVQVVPILLMVAFALFIFSLVFGISYFLFVPLLRSKLKMKKDLKELQVKVAELSAKQTN